MLGINLGVEIPSPSTEEVSILYVRVNITVVPSGCRSSLPFDGLLLGQDCEELEKILGA